MHLALFQSPDTAQYHWHCQQWTTESNQTFPTKLEIIEQSSANVMILKKLLKELQGILFPKQLGIFFEKLLNFNLFKARMSENV